jgi:hypothetical protein
MQTSAPLAEYDVARNADAEHIEPTLTEIKELGVEERRHHVLDDNDHMPIHPTRPQPQKSRKCATHIATKAAAPRRLS